jgi:hypothetical protein
LFLIASLILFWPAIVTKIFNLDYSFRYYMYIAGIVIYALSYLIQKFRLKALEGQGGHYSKSSSKL